MLQSIKLSAIVIPHDDGAILEKYWCTCHIFVLGIVVCELELKFLVVMHPLYDLSKQNQKLMHLMIFFFFLYSLLDDAREIVFIIRGLTRKPSIVALSVLELHISIY